MQTIEKTMTDNTCRYNFHVDNDGGVILCDAVPLIQADGAAIQG